MQKGYEAPPGVDIAALRNRKTNVAMDLMRPGEGTPWEDRGSLGVVKAFFVTCMKSITSPGMLLDHIRRPDTTKEASFFAYGCAAFWAVSTVIHMLIWDKLYRPAWASRLLQEYDFTYDRQFYIKIAIMSVAVAVASYVLLVWFASRMYFAMISTELKNNAPRVLLHNMFCYCMGPSILSIIPVVGPPLALALIFIDWCVGGAKRLYISWRGTVVAAVLSMAVSLVIFAAAWFVLSFISSNMLSLKEPPAQQQSDGTYGTKK
jgi:hypothetical protein